jgi:hypothetical protein
MKKINLWYWIVTILFAAFMVFTAIPDIMMSEEAVTFMTQLGYPKYFVSFIGWAKILGVIGILVPGFPRVKEWAYAGLAFDIVGATYSQIAAFGFHPPMSFMLLLIIFLILSYWLYHKRLSGLKRA